MAALETVTIAFVDLVGSTSLASELGPVDYEEFRVGYFGSAPRSAGGGRRPRGEEHRRWDHGGLRQRRRGSRVLRRRSAVAEARRRIAGLPLRVRAGLNLGDAESEDGDYHGMTVIEAARLCDAADADQILVTEVVRAMVGARHEGGFEAVGSLQLKGIPDPVLASEVHWEPIETLPSARPLPRRLRRASAAGYVGREDVLGSLGALAEASVGGAQQVALLAGEPGIGKTRLATQVALSRAAQGTSVLYGRCDESLRLPYGPWIEALAHLAEQLPDETLQAQVDSHGAEIARLIPALGSRVAVPPRADVADPETERYLMWTAVADLLEAASAESPLVLILDDLHWADAPSLALLSHVLASVPEARLLTIGTYRDAEPTSNPQLSDWLADLRRQPNVERIALDGLRVGDVEALMATAASSELDETGRRLALEILAETDGNPFFVDAVIAHLLESGSVAIDPDGSWELRQSLAELRLPEGVREVVRQRVDRLGEVVAQTLSMAAVIGRDFELPLLTSVLEKSEESVLETLDTV